MTSGVCNAVTCMLLFVDGPPGSHGGGTTGPGGGHFHTSEGGLFLIFSYPIRSNRHVQHDLIDPPISAI